MFTIFRLPFWLLAGAAVLLIERPAWTRFRVRQRASLPVLRCVGRLGRDHVGRKMKRRVLILIVLTATLRGGETAEAELARLQQTMKSAMSQAAMNEASGELAKYWDRALEKEEAKILASCDSERALLFRSAQKSWRDFRLAEAKLQGDFSRDGSIQPLAHNSTFASTTERRVKELRAMSAPQ